MMTTREAPYLTNEGVAFTVAVGFVKRECLIPKQTLSYICRSWGDDMDCMNAFRAYEDTIISVARRLAVSGASKSPVILERRFFTNH
jgi:hypothetical protein